MRSQPSPTSPTAPTEGSSAASHPAWGGAELVDPHSRADKSARVRRMFSAIASSYDLNNRVHSLWRDQAWRRRAVREADVQDGDVVVDVACGTGDLTHLFARTGAREVIGLDFTPEMLDLAERKRGRLADDVGGKVRYLQGDAQELPLDNQSADVVSIAFGIRNVEEPARAIGEFARVLRPGGRLVVLEFDQPRLAPVRWFNTLYCARIMPRTATWISGDKSGAYAYLPRSVKTFLSRERMGELIRGAGFEDVRARSLSLGICACYRAVRAPG